MANVNRRLFMKSMGAATFAGSLSALSGLSGTTAAAASTTGYKALVCIFLDGGMDHSDTLIPYDQSSFNQLASLRPNIISGYGGSRSRENLLPLNPVNSEDFGGRQVAMPAEFQEIFEMFESGDAAVVTSLGPLLETVTRNSMENGSALLPARLYSHNDQAATWLTLHPEGQSRSGWGGKFADAVVKSNPNENPLFSVINTDQRGLFLAGEEVRPFLTSVTGPTLPRVLRSAPAPGEFAGIGNTEGDQRAREIMREYFERTSTSHTNLFQRDYVAANSRAIPNTEQYSLALSRSAPITAPYPANNRLAENLRAIAEAINIQQHIGNSRQVFFARLGGFDTHAKQSQKLPELQRTLSQAIASFRDALVGIGMWDSTTIFTASEFGRTVVENGDGTDHGWGGHQFVFGGNVAGKHIYGPLESMDINGPEYTRFRGRLIPTQSVEQFAATLGGWFGLEKAELKQVFPNLDNFATSDLGFMRG